MRNALVLVLLGVFGLTTIGCQNNKTSDKNSSADTMKMDAGKDDCPMCPGIQHAKADGTCPECGMKVK